MIKITVGCAGWSYKDWLATFYPKSLHQNQFLTYYAKFFNYTEINSTFYRLPAENAAHKWLNAVPEDFRFAVKVWQGITHKKSGSEGANIKTFLARLKPLEPKIKGYLLQFPPMFRYKSENLDRLTKILDKFPDEKPIYTEFRHDTWFNPEILDSFIDGSRVILVTNYKEGVQPIYLDNQSVYYIRLIGDRELTVFNGIQRSQDEILQKVKERLDSWEQQPGIREALITFNNHFRGFSPQDVNEFKQKRGLEFRNFGKKLKKQPSLMDFMNK